jgi:hypothetical protein
VRPRMQPPHARRVSRADMRAPSGVPRSTFAASSGGKNAGGVLLFCGCVCVPTTLQSALPLKSAIVPSQSKLHEVTQRGVTTEFRCHQTTHVWNGTPASQSSTSNWPFLRSAGRRRPARMGKRRSVRPSERKSAPSSMLCSKKKATQGCSSRRKRNVSSGLSVTRAHKGAERVLPKQVRPRFGASSTSACVTKSGTILAMRSGPAGVYVSFGAIAECGRAKQ